jgi:hypothetical protein
MKTNGIGQVPRIITVVPLLPSLSPKRFVANLITTLGLPDSEQEDVLATIGEAGNYLVRAPRYKTSLQINVLPSLNVYDTLDSVLISDYVVLLTSSVDEVQLEGEAVLRCLQGQAGGIEIISCVQVCLAASVKRIVLIYRRQRINQSSPTPNNLSTNPYYPSPAISSQQSKRYIRPIHPTKPLY